MSRHVRTITSAAAIAALVSALSPSVHADDAKAKAKYEEAKQAFALRGTDPQAIEKALGALMTAEFEAQDTDLKYDVLVLESRALYFKGVHTADKELKKNLHLAGQQKADAAEALTSDYAEAPYYAGINLARWGKANGPLQSIAKLGKLKEYMAKASDSVRTTRDDQAAESVDGYGPSRTLGRAAYVLRVVPGMGSRADAVRLLSVAHKNAPTLALNTVYLADALLSGDSAEKAEGRKLLNELLAKDPATLNPGRPFETAEEFQMARDVLAGKEID